MSSALVGGFWRHLAPKPRGGVSLDEDDDKIDEAATKRPLKVAPGQETPLANHGSGLAAPTAIVTGGGDVDILDAFMAEIDAEVAKAASRDRGVAPEELQASDPVADYLEVCKKGPKQSMVGSDAEDEEDEREGEDRRKKPIEPLPAIDHSQITYNKVRSEFYTPHADLERLSPEQVMALRKELRISATGSNVPAPTASFAYLAHTLGAELMEGIRRHGYAKPTNIQAQALPVALSGRDIIGIAETGSGKTVAYLLPMLVHAIAQPVLEKDEGPIGVVLCPTRELAVQIEQETYKFNKLLGLRSVTLAGGLPKLEQFREIKRGAEIAICNPGRLIDIVKMKGCNLRRVTFVVLDEADRMFSMGFEYQVRSIVQNVRPTRQTMLFSATFPPKIERLARDILHQPVRVTIGEAGQAASNVMQHIGVIKNDDEKWDWLSTRIDEMVGKGQVLIFVKSIASAEELTQNFQDFLGKKTEFLHGDLDQGERMRILKSYKRREIDVLIATDVAARGLDIASIFTVVSYDCARDIETHTHRIGRTGRAGAAGEAYTMLTQEDEHDRKMAALLVGLLEQASQDISDDHQNLAMRYAPYRSAQLAGKKFEGKKKGFGGKAVHSAFGLGFDGKAIEKETAQDLERRLNKEADQMTKRNRNIMATIGQGRSGMGTAPAPIPRPGVALGGFVAAAMEDKQVEIPKPDIPSDSDDDLFAPGVTGSFGVGGCKGGKGGKFGGRGVTRPAWESQPVTGSAAPPIQSHARCGWATTASRTSEQVGVSVGAQPQTQLLQSQVADQCLSATLAHPLVHSVREILPEASTDTSTGSCIRSKSRESESHLANNASGRSRWRSRSPSCNRSREVELHPGKRGTSGRSRWRSRSRSVSRSREREVPSANSASVRSRRRSRSREGAPTRRRSRSRSRDALQMPNTRRRSRSPYRDREIRRGRR